VSYEGEFGCGARHCPEGYTCTVGGRWLVAGGWWLAAQLPCFCQAALITAISSNPAAPSTQSQAFPTGTNINVSGFDNVALSFLTVFQCMTLSGWSYIMYRWVGARGWMGECSDGCGLVALQSHTKHIHHNRHHQSNGRRGWLQCHLLCAAGHIWGVLCGECFDCQRAKDSGCRAQ